MKLEPERVLVVSPHTDDAEVSSGGTISRFLREGREVWVLVLSEAFAEDPGLPRQECMKALGTLGVTDATIMDFPVRRLAEHRQEILDSLIRLKNWNPDLVILPSLNDIHQDHHTVAREGLRAFRDSCTLLGYEYPWNLLTFNTACFIKLAEEDIENKVRAISEYQSQQKDYMRPDLIRAWALTRGVAVDTKYAESFEVMRLVA